MKKILVFEIPNTINEENVIIAPGQEEKQSVSILGDEFCEEQTFLHLNQYFASDVDYPFFARSVYEQRHLRHQ